MEEFDDKALHNVDDDELLMKGVICGDHELFYLHCYLSEVLRNR